MEPSTETFQIKRLGEQDVQLIQKLILVFKEVFEVEKTAGVNTSYLMALLKKPDFIVYAVLMENKVVGGLTAYELPMYHTEQSELFIYDIAIKAEYQRKGWGKKLLSTLNEYGRERGIKAVFVDASQEDTHAVEFYHASGGKPEKVVQFTFALNN